MIRRPGGIVHNHFSNRATHRRFFQVMSGLVLLLAMISTVTVA
jgi:hypothetical protein